jgi:hypothetical protein
MEKVQGRGQGISPRSARLPRKSDNHYHRYGYSNQKHEKKDHRPLVYHQLGGLWSSNLNSFPSKRLILQKPQYTGYIDSAQHAN